MRLLHTSDWHLGQHFMGKTREAEHRAFFAWLLEQVCEQAVDVLLVAGDIFDTGTPPSYARELYNQLIVDVRRSGCGLVILGGNHDSVAMLGESRGLLAELGAQVVPAVAADPASQVLELRCRDGRLGALLCAVPFIRPRDVAQSQAGQSAEDKQQSLLLAIQAHYRHLFGLAEARRAELGGDLPIIASGHLTTVGATASESVREIYVGSLAAFPSHAFPPADYIALGHIHRAQRVAEHIHYSGSPIPLSFDEARQQKQVILVELDGTGLRGLTALPVPCFQPLLSLAGTLAELPAQLAEAARLGSAQRPLWLELRIASDDYLSDLQQRLGTLCEGLPVEVLRVRRERGERRPGLQRQARETLDELSPEEVFGQRLAGEQLEPELQRQLHGLYRTVLEELREDTP